MNNVIVIIPHFNNSAGLIRSVASIEANEAVDVLIVDDGSTEDPIDEQLTSLSFKAAGDVKYIYLGSNKGIETALNTGLDHALEHGYKYIARLDSDDSCIGSRFKIQQKYLEDHPDIKLVGSNAIAVDTEDKFLYNIIKPAAHAEIKRKMYINSMFVHPSVMFCTDILEHTGQYPTSYKAAEDYAFFFTITKMYKTANIQQYLIKYEINPGGISSSKRKQQVLSRIRIIIKNFKGGFYPVLGIVRNSVIYFMPTAIINFIKQQ